MLPDIVNECNVYYKNEGNSFQKAAFYSSCLNVVYITKIAESLSVLGSNQRPHFFYNTNVIYITESSKFKNEFTDRHDLLNG